MECPKCGAEMVDRLELLSETETMYRCLKCGNVEFVKLFCWGEEQEEDEEPDFSDF